MQKTGYHHANHLAQQLKTDIQQRDSDLLTYIQSVIDSSSQPGTGSLTGTMTPSDMSTMTPTQYQANATQTDTVQLEMLKKISKFNKVYRQRMDNKEQILTTTTITVVDTEVQSKLLTTLPLIEENG